MEFKNSNMAQLKDDANLSKGRYSFNQVFSKSVSKNQDIKNQQNVGIYMGKQFPLQHLDADEKEVQKPENIQILQNLNNENNRLYLKKNLSSKEIAQTIESQKSIEENDQKYKSLKLRLIGCQKTIKNLEETIKMQDMAIVDLREKLSDKDR